VLPLAFSIFANLQHIVLTYPFVRLAADAVIVAPGVVAADAVIVAPGVVAADAVIVAPVVVAADAVIVAPVVVAAVALVELDAGISGGRERGNKRSGVMLLMMALMLRWDWAEVFGAQDGKEKDFEEVSRKKMQDEDTLRNWEIHDQAET
jgi:hypothetical protein